MFGKCYIVTDAGIKNALVLIGVYVRSVIRKKMKREISVKINYRQVKNLINILHLEGFCIAIDCPIKQNP